MLQLGSLTLPSAILSPFSLCYHTVTSWLCFCVCFCFQVPAVSRAGGGSYIVNFFSIHGDPSLPRFVQNPDVLNSGLPFPKRMNRSRSTSKKRRRRERFQIVGRFCLFGGVVASYGQASVDDDNENQEILEPRSSPSTQSGSQRLSSPFFSFVYLMHRLVILSCSSLPHIVIAAVRR